MKHECRFFVGVILAVGLMIFGTALTASAAPALRSGARRRDQTVPPVQFRPPPALGYGGYGWPGYGGGEFGGLNGGGVIRRQPGRPPAPGVGNWRPQLEAALQALFAADQAMRFSANPNVAEVVGDLTVASRNLRGLPSIFDGHWGAAIRDTEAAINDMRQVQPNPRAIAFTDEAITNAQICLQVHR